MFGGNSAWLDKDDRSSENDWARWDKRGAGYSAPVASTLRGGSSRRQGAFDGFDASRLSSSLLPLLSISTLLYSSSVSPMPEYRELFASVAVTRHWFEDDTVQDALKNDALVLRWIWVDAVLDAKKKKDIIVHSVQRALDGHVFIATKGDTMYRGSSGAQQPLLPPTLPNVIMNLKLRSYSCTPRTIIFKFDKCVFQVR